MQGSVQEASCAELPLPVSSLWERLALSRDALWRQTKPICESQQRRGYMLLLITPKNTQILLLFIAVHVLHRLHNGNV